jgi:hypothetical protein
MSSGVSSKTPFYGFNLINFDYPRWSTFEHENWTKIDAIMQASGVVNAGLWANSTVYLAGARVVDPTDFRIYNNNVTHTSAASPTTFAADRAANPTYWSVATNAPIYRGDWAALTVYNYLDIVRNTTDGAFYICIIAHTSGGSFVGTFWTQSSPGFLSWANITGKPSSFPSDFAVDSTNPPPLAQCRLELSGGNLVLNRRNGKYLWINGKNEVIPSGGVSLAPSGLIQPQATTNRVIASSVATLTFASNVIPVGANIAVKGVRNGSNYKGYGGTAVVSAQSGTTISYPSHQGVVTDASAADTTGSVSVWYYIYAFMVGSTMTLEAVFTGYSIDASTGMPYKTGDATRTLVGMGLIDTGPAWVDTAAKRGVRSYFNRKHAVCHRELSTNDINVAPTTASINIIELNVSYRAEWLQWADECAVAALQGMALNNTAGATTYTHCVIDNVPQAGNGPLFSGSANAGYTYYAAGRVLESNEGYHYCSMWGQVASGTGTWSAADAVGGGNTGSMDVRIG